MKRKIKELIQSINRQMDSSPRAIKVIYNFVFNRLTITLILVYILPFLLATKLSVKMIAALPSEIAVLFFMIFYYVWVIAMSVSVVAAFERITIKLDVFLNKKPDKGESIYYWLGKGDIADSSIMEIFDEGNFRNNKNVVLGESEKLTLAKQMLRDHLNSNLNNYISFKDYLEFRLKNNTYTKINKYILTFIVTTPIPFLVNNLLKNNFSIYGLDIIISRISNNTLFENYLIFIMCIAGYLIISGFINNIFSRSRRLKFTLLILDMLIREEERKKENIEVI